MVIFNAFISTALHPPLLGIVTDAMISLYALCVAYFN